MKRIATFVVALLLVAVAGSVAWSADGKALYDKSCASCHGAGGKGDGPAAKAMKNKPPDLAGAGVKGMSDADVAKFITEGKAGTTHPKAKLSADDAEAVAKYVKSL